MNTIELSCQCGQVQGIAKNIDPKAGTRLVCYCDDCQAFAEHLDQGKDVLDPYGGTEIYQLAPAQIEITQGSEQLRSLRLTEKGLVRWYAACCDMPIANTISAAVPFVGLVHSFRVDSPTTEEILGPIKAHVYGQYAKKPLPEDRKKQSSALKYMFKIIPKLLLWKLKGLGQPSPFFGREGEPMSEPTVVNSQ
ncbi:MAG: DUF6151 family protein [Cyanobacteria bacterium P01_G01_bin.54]